MPDRERLIKGIIATGKKLAGMGLVTAAAGNLSCRLDSKRALITATGSRLGKLSPSDIVIIDLASGKTAGPRKPSSESPLHRLIYLSFPDTGAVVHCHPSFINAYFCLYPRLRYLTFESRYYLGDVPVVRQKSLTVTDPKPVIEALRRNPLTVIRNHGVFSKAATLGQALERVEILEEAVRVFALARLFNRQGLDALDRELKRCLRKK
ncbi:MAG: class II aldolase/adducin family protein [Deltaproteobacteria bacterium]